MPAWRSGATSRGPRLLRGRRWRRQPDVAQLGVEDAHREAVLQFLVVRPQAALQGEPAVVLDAGRELPGIGIETRVQTHTRRAGREHEPPRRLALLEGASAA